MDGLKLLIATDNGPDADLIKSSLLEEFKNVKIFRDERTIAGDFDAYLPDILILAFDKFEKAEHYSLILNKTSARIHTHLHRSILLCNAQDSSRVYENCKKQIFDDYVLYWPIGHDVHRLKMAVHHAAKWIELGKQSGQTEKRLITSARALMSLDEDLPQMCKQTARHVEDFRKSIDSFESSACDEIVRLGQQLLTEVDANDNSAPSTRMEGELEELRAERLRKLTADIRASAAPLAESGDGIVAALANNADSLRDIKSCLKALKPRILVVDDDEYQCMILQEIIGNQGYEVHSVNTGAEAFAYIKRRVPNLIFLDIDLPDINGMDILRTLKDSETSQSITVFIITGEKSRSKVLTCIESGADDYIVKPFDRAVILQKLESQL